jgi:hypothetical protein
LLLSSVSWQPLHIGFRSDGGGNNVSVDWYRRKTNLHNVCTASQYEMSSTSFFLIKMEKKGVVD